MLMKYECTELGIALCDYVIDKLGILEPEMIKYYEEKLMNVSNQIP